MEVKIMSKEITLEKAQETLKPVIVAKKKVDSEIGKKIPITLDMREEDIIHLDKDGYKLIFDTTEDNKFRILPKNILDELSRENRERYYLVYGQWKTDLDAKPTEGIKIRPNFSSAITRLEVLNKKPEYGYGWVRPDQLQRVDYEGGYPCVDPDVITFGNTEDKHKHTISGGGIVELILCQWPIDKWNETKLFEPGRVSKERNEGVIGSAKDKLPGGYIPKTNDGRNWS